MKIMTPADATNVTITDLMETYGADTSAMSADDLIITATAYAKAAGLRQDQCAFTFVELKGAKR